MKTYCIVCKEKTDNVRSKVAKAKNGRLIQYVLIMSRTRFRVNPHSIVASMSRNSLLEAGAKSEI